jgi:peptide/nickel transport system substrate-binding protein
VISKTALVLGAGLALGLWAGAPVTPAVAATPTRGGILKFVVPAEPPSFDAHRETTFALIHPLAPFYSVLVRVNPDNPSSPTDFVCDLCTEMPQPTNGGKTYTFNIRKGVKFHDGSKLTAHDIAASFRKIASPPEGVASARKAFFVMVDKISTPDDHTVVFDLKYPSGAFIPALANPYNFIYAKKILDKDMHWYEKNVMGSGPFTFKERQPGAFISGRRNPAYYHEGKPYLDGFRAIFAKKQSLRVQAIRGGRASIEFRGFPPKSRDDLKRALGDKVTVQESDWNCNLLIVPNHKVKPFDDARVRRALTLAIDRWGGSKYLSRIAIVKTVGGVAFPGHPLAANRKELESMAGYWPDLAKSRAEAKRLLAEAGYPNGFPFELHNRGIDQPYKIVGTWLIDQWRQIGLKVKQRVQPTGPFYATLRTKRDFQVSIDFNCQSVVNPLLDVAKYMSDNRTGNNYAGYQDPAMDKMFDAMNRSGDPAEQRRIMRKYEKRALDEEAHMFLALWWYRIIPHRSNVKGWKISPSHYLNQDLSGVWLAR